MAVSYYRAPNAKAGQSGTTSAMKGPPGSGGPRGPADSATASRPSVALENGAPRAASTARDFNGTPAAQYDGTHLSPEARATLASAPPAAAAEISRVSRTDLEDSAKPGWQGGNRPAPQTDYHAWGTTAGSPAQGGPGDFPKGMK